jgi:hypothetical protein
MSLTDLALSPFSVAAIVFAVFGTILLFAGIVSLFRMRPLGFVVRMLTGLLLLSLGGLAGAIAIGIQGYRALTREDVAARVSVRPAGPQRFTATLRFPDGREARFDIAGDEIYIDAHILKWKPAANVLGLRTAYELDRVAGRYHAVEQERSSPRTVHALGQQRRVDLFSLRRRYAFLDVFLDAEYGSATFVPVEGPAELELRISTTGLLLRPAGTG